MATRLSQHNAVDRRAELAVGCILAARFGGAPRLLPPASALDVELVGETGRVLAVAEVRRRSFGSSHPWASDLPIRKAKLRSLRAARAPLALYVLALNDGAVYAAPVLLLEQAFRVARGPLPFTCSGSDERPDPCYRASVLERPFLRLPGCWLTAYVGLYGEQFPSHEANLGRARYSGLQRKGGGFSPSL